MVWSRVVRIVNRVASQSEALLRGDRGARRRMVWCRAVQASNRVLNRGASRSEVWCPGDWDASQRRVSNSVLMVWNRGAG